jgi:hypothetical protein
LAAVASVLLGLSLAGCTKADTKKSSSDTTPVSSSAGSPTSSSAATASATPRPSVSAKPTATLKPTLGGRCEDLLPVTTIENAIGLPVIGKTSFIIGVPEPNIGRLVRLLCRYGISAPAKGKPAVPKVEISLSLYDTSAQAEGRVRGTIEDYRSHGASQKDAAVGQFPATILVGFGSPTLVASAGPRTVAITVDPKLIASTHDAGLVSIAKAALDASAKFNQGGGPATSPTTTP